MLQGYFWHLHRMKVAPRFLFVSAEVIPHMYLVLIGARVDLTCQPASASLCVLFTSGLGSLCLCICLIVMKEVMTVTWCIVHSVKGCEFHERWGI